MKKHSLFRIFCLLIIIVVIIVLDARYINPYGLKVKEIPIYDNKLSSDYNGFKIVQFSDLHYGRTTNEDTLKKVVAEINELKADIVIFTGDLFDSDNISPADQELITNYLKKINAKLFKFATLGDYDEKILDTYEVILANSDFIFLNNSSKLVYDNTPTPLNFIGISSLDNIDELYNNEYYNITLLHKPDLIKNINNTNLAFAGHSLGGQIRIPFIGGIRKKDGANTYLESFYQINNTKLYISNGIGTEDFSLRLFNTPSITLYRLYNS